MNWGKRIVVLYVAFVAMILFLVIKAMNEDVDLVSADYYQKELKFQEQIDRSKESQTLAEQPLVKIVNGAVEIKFPEKQAKEHVSGKIDFYRPSDSSKDLSFEIQADSIGTQKVSLKKMIKGIYSVRLTWEAAGKNYYNDLPLYIP